MPFNKILTNEDREHFKPTIDLMFHYCPEMMSRKISEANVQQAFTLDTAMFFKGQVTAEILSAGSWEDTATETLKAIGRNVTDIDPVINYDLHTFAKNTDKKFDVIISTSVLEHVGDDEEFIEDVCNLLKDDGYAIFTMDFNNNYKNGSIVPATVVRQYTRYDLEKRLPKILEKNHCYLVDNGDWTAEPDFIYQGHLYSFATFVFRKGQENV